MNILFKETPKLFGAFHIVSLILTVLVSVFLMLLFRNAEEKKLISFLHIAGLIMILAEVWKQIFTFIYVFDSIYNMWFFPWQLCSMAMYLSFIIPYLNEEKQNACLVFIATFSLFSAIISLIAPLDMLRPQVLLTCHGFLYHAFMVFEAIAAIFILKKRIHSFKPSVVLFLIMAFIAEIINITAHQIFHDIHREPDMFYITPYYATTQPVFHDIALRFGIPVEVILYLGTIIGVSYLLYMILLKKKR